MNKKSFKSQYIKLITILFLLSIEFTVQDQIDINLVVKMRKRAQIRNLPSFYITTAGPVFSKDIGVKEKLFIAGIDSLKDDSIEIRGRGNGTWNMAKKPYRIKPNSKTNLPYNISLPSGLYVNTINNSVRKLAIP